jgi:hypothetical protein
MAILEVPKFQIITSRDEQAGLAPEAVTIGDFRLERKHNG